ncbi:MAG: helix-turn-helix domain-containing protein [Lachnospiraceae bacterium]|nr:helix-turn-helix domain-containing protein [Lachnospiraceae bacterium]
MKLSMSMLSWYLKQYHPICIITNDENIIRGMRFLPNDNFTPHPEYVYFGEARYFLSDPNYKTAYIVVHRQSYLLFQNCEYENLLNELLSSFDYFTDWEGRLLEAASLQTPVQKMLDIADEVIENPLILGDMFGIFYASTAAAEIPVDPYWDFGIHNHTTHPSVSSEPFYNANDGNLIRDLSESPQMVRNVYPGSPPVLMMYLKQDQEFIACLAILQKDRTFTVMNQQLAPLLAHYFVKAAEFTSPSASIKSSEFILNEILDGKMQDQNAIRHLEQKGLRNPWRLLLFCHISRNDKIQKSALIHTLQKLPLVYIPFIYNNHVLAIVSEQACQNFINYFGESLNLSTLRIGVSMLSADWKTLPIRYQQASFALEQGNKESGVYRCEDYAFAYLIQTFQSQEMVFPLLHPALDVLTRYDCSNKSELRKTLSVYLQKEMNLIDAANALNIHRNTLKYRLKRIKELTHLTLKEENELAYLRLSDWLSK